MTKALGLFCHFIETSNLSLPEGILVFPGFPTFLSRCGKADSSVSPIGSSKEDQ